jgi:hypothetical protein
MGHIDSCLGALRRLIANGDMSGIPLVKAAIEEYWAATPAKARKSGLLYIQQSPRSARRSQSAKQGFRSHRGRLHRKEACRIRPPVTPTSAQSHSLARNSLFIALGFPVGNWLAAPFTLLGVTFQNWMLLALATVLVWIVLVRLTRP